MKTNFIRKPNSDDLKEIDNSPKLEKFVVEKVIKLEELAFIEFASDPLQDYNFIKDNLDLMYEDDKRVFHTIFVTCESFNWGVLVESEGYTYARYASVYKVAKIKEHYPELFSDIKRCSLCGTILKENEDNNPYPFKGDKCCDKCNREIIVPLRIIQTLDKPNFAILLKTDNTAKIIKPKDKTFTLEELQSCVGGLIETYPSDYNRLKVICNEEGLILNLPQNKLICKLINEKVVGDILLFPNHFMEDNE